MDKKQVFILCILACFAILIISCPEDDDDLDFVDFYSPDSGCETSTWIYDINGKETRVRSDTKQLHINDDDCTIENSEVKAFDLYLNSNLFAKCRCAYAAEGDCRYFWVNPVDGAFVIISGNCTDGYSFTYTDVIYDKCE